MENNSCSGIGIPRHLIRNEREADQSFSESEVLYRRFYTDKREDVWIDDKNVSASIWPIQNDSCTRQKYGNDHTDALYNKNAESKTDHFFEWGVVSIPVYFIGEFEKVVDEKRTYSATPSHEPEDCIYTHAEIHILLNGERFSEKRPKSVKTLFRDILIVKCSIEKDPDIWKD